MRNCNVNEVIILTDRTGGQESSLSSFASAADSASSSDQIVATRGQVE